MPNCVCACFCLDNLSGTGKSHVLRVAIKYLRSMFPQQVHVTAPTGVAACNIGGKSIANHAECNGLIAKTR